MAAQEHYRLQKQQKADFEADATKQQERSKLQELRQRFEARLIALWSILL